MRAGAPPEVGDAKWIVNPKRTATNYYVLSYKKDMHSIWSSVLLRQMVDIMNDTHTRHRHLHTYFWFGHRKTVRKFEKKINKTYNQAVNFV